MFSTLILVLILLLNTNLRSSAERTLEMVNVVYRHGARAPIEFYPNDPHQESAWPDGAAQLTQNGMRIEYNLGLFLKKRYVDNKKFLNKAYHHRNIYIRSSSVNRCLQSAESQLAGLFPPAGHQVWNPAIPWQPIPIHTVPKDNDPLLRSADDSCPRRDAMLKKMRKKPVFVKRMADSEELFRIMTNKSGMEVNADNAWVISDCAFCERAQNLTVQKWIVDIFDQMADFTYWVFQYKYNGDGSDEVARLTGGPLLGTIVDNMVDSLTNTTTSDLYKMNIFSGHDSSLLALSAGLNVPIAKPLYGACIMLELYRTTAKGGYVVEMVYRNAGNLTQLKLKECPFSCPIDQFVRLTKNRVSRDRRKECGLDNSILTPTTLRVLTLVFFISTLVLLYVVTCLLCKVWTKNKKKNRALDDDEEQRSPLIET